MQEDKERTEEKEGAWMQGYQPNDFPNKPKLNLKDGEKAIIEFKNEGKTIHHPQYGDAVLFEILEKSRMGATDEGYKPVNVQEAWFVSTKKWSLLKEISARKPITGKTATVSRTGKDKNDTKYSIYFKEGITVEKAVI